MFNNLIVFYKILLIVNVQIEITKSEKINSFNSLISNFVIISFQNLNNLLKLRFA